MLESENDSNAPQLLQALSKIGDTEYHEMTGSENIEALGTLSYLKCRPTFVNPLHLKQDTSTWKAIDSRTRMRFLSGRSNQEETHLKKSCKTKVVSPPRTPRRKSGKQNSKSKAAKYQQASLLSNVHLNSILLQKVIVSPTPSSSQSVMISLESSLSSLLELPIMPTTPKAPRKTYLPTQLRIPDQPEVTVVFCIRRPGCGSCRETGLQLADFAQQFGSKLNLFGIIKETGVDDKALTNFYTKFFPFPLYKDTDRKAFQFLGNRKISVWKLLRTAPRMLRRYHEMGIENIPFGGDIWTEGGIMIFNKKGHLMYVYYEQYSQELDTEALRLAIEGCIAGEPPDALFAPRTSTEISEDMCSSLTTTLTVSCSLDGSAVRRSTSIEDKTSIRRSTHPSQLDCDSNYPSPKSVVTPRQPRRQSDPDSSRCSRDAVPPRLQRRQDCKRRQRSVPPRIPKRQDSLRNQCSAPPRSRYSSSPRIPQRQDSQSSNCSGDVAPSETSRRPDFCSNQCSSPPQKPRRQNSYGSIGSDDSSEESLW